MGTAQTKKWVYLLCSLFILFWSRTSAAIFIPGIGICQERLTVDPEGEGEPDPAKGPTLKYEVAKGDHVVGRLTVTLSPDRRSVTSAEGDVNPPQRRNGIYRALIAQMMADQPQVRTVDAQLKGSNLEAYREALVLEPINGEPSEVKRNAAIRTTPLYKVFAPFGFTNMQVITSESGDVFVALSKSADESVPASVDAPMSF